MRFQVLVLSLSFLFAATTFATETFRCTNLSRSSQAYPSIIDLRLQPKSAEIHVVSIDPSGFSLATVGSTYKAKRLSKSQEKKYGQPTYTVSDSADDIFANDERDSDVFIFVSERMLQSENGKVTVWLHYNGGDYRGVDTDTFSCQLE